MEIFGPASLAFFGAVLATLAGCLENGNQETLTDESSVRSDADLWGNRSRLLVLEVHGDFYYDFDVLCLTGGGPLLSREGMEKVLSGTSKLDVFVRVDPTFYGYQLGYVLDDTPAEHESEQEGITWLPQVDLSEETYEIDVSKEGHERLDGPYLWAFYYRLSLDGQSCYTGAGTGKWDVNVEAVRGSEADGSAKDKPFE